MKTLVVRFAICLLIYFIFQPATLATGVPDRSFGTNGVVTTPLTFAFSSYGNVAIQPDGKYIIVESGNEIRMSRFTVNGSFDTNFGNNGTIFHPAERVAVSAVAVQQDGKIIVGGTLLLQPGGSARDFFIARFDTHGSLDPLFGTNGIKTFDYSYADFLNALAIQPDGKIVATGSAGGGSETSRNVVIRFNTNGTVDTAFANQGVFNYTFPSSLGYANLGFYDIAVFPNGRIVAGASFGRQVPDPNSSYLGYYLIMLDANGALMPDFGVQGLATGGRIKCCGLFQLSLSFEALPSGRIFLAFAGGVYVVNQDGSLYKQLPYQGGRTNILPNGRVLVGDGGARLYSETNLIGIGDYGARVYALPNGKILTLTYDYGNNILTHRRYNAITSIGTANADFDRDFRADQAVFNRQTQTFTAYISSSGTTFTRQEPLTKVIPDMNETRPEQSVLLGNGITFWRNNLPNGSAPTFGQYFPNSPSTSYGFWGLPDDMPVGGDFNGDGLTDFTVFRPSNGVWYSKRGEGGEIVFYQWGANGDKPVPADYDYDGRTDYAVYRPSTGTWWVRRSSDNNYVAFNFGIATDIPLTGDYDGDGRADFTVYRPSESVWYQHLTTEGFRALHFGLPGDYPVPGDYDGDGRHDIAVYRNSYWYMLQSTVGFRTWRVTDHSEWVTPVSIRYDE